MTGIVDAVLGKGDAPINALKDFKPVGIDAGGFKFGLSGGQITGGSTPERLGLISNISSLFREQAGELRGLRSLVAPGFSRLRAGLQASQAARLASLEAAETRAIGDVRENLQRRRVLGSSFGQDALSRSRAEFAQQKDEVRAEIAIQEAQTTLQELESTRQLIKQEFNLSRNAIQVFLNNLNLEADIATKLAGGATNALASIAQMQAKLLQEQINNTQSFITDLLGVGTGFALGGVNPFQITPTSSTSFTPA